MMQRIHGLVACSDLTGYAKLAAKKNENEIFQLLSDYYELVGDVIAPARGKVIKYMGDAALLLFEEDAIDGAVRTMLDLQSQGDRLLAEYGTTCRQHIRIHFGPMCIGLLGTRDDKRLDVIGSTVNAMFLLKTSGFSMTPEVFRKLAPDTRKHFKKHTPPVIYIPTDQPHRD